MDDPFFAWTTPDETARRALLEAMFSLAVKAGDAQGFLRLDDRGVSVLIPPGRQLYDAEESAIEQGLLRKAFHRSGAILDDYRRRLRSSNPDATGYWYLHYLAVPTAKRRRGLGSSMMTDILTQTAGAPLWLHTGRPSNLGFYAGFGLKIIAITPCEPGGPYVYTLRKLPSPTGQPTNPRTD